MGIPKKAEEYLSNKLVPKILFAIADARFDPLDRVTKIEPFYVACTAGLLDVDDDSRLHVDC